MFKPAYFFILFLCLCACSTRWLSTEYNLPKQNGTGYIGHYEVTVGDWLTYMVVTNFPEGDEAIYLGDQTAYIAHQLPNLTVGGWGSYVISAFLISEKDSTKGKLTSETVFNHCANTYIELMLPAKALDSILKYNLLNMPVVGITYEQALDYLRYKQGLLNACFGEKEEGKYRYECFLPTPEQFDSVQTTMDSLNTKRCHLFNYKDALCPDCPNAKHYMKSPVLSRIGREPVPADSYFPNDFGLYNIKGNVAEMTSVKGIAKGGSCVHYASEAYAGKLQEYTQPEVWLGLRVWYRVSAK